MQNHYWLWQEKKFNMSRVIFHIDMNSYFASVARAMQSDLEGQCVAVSNSLAPHGIISSATYEAREYGVHSAMTNKDALQLCPHLIIVETDFEAYKRYTKKFFDIVRSYSVYIEPASIDECYVDVSETIKQFKRPLDLAWIIQNRLLEELKLPCSIGVASNKFLAKMASDLKKPLGITVLRKNQLRDKLWPLSISEMYGIGKISAKKLIENGILSIGDLVDEKNYQKVKLLLGSQAEKLILNAKGFDPSALEYNQSIQSISQSKTYTKEIEQYEEIVAELKRLTNKVCIRAVEKEMQGRHISLVIRNHHLKTIIRSISIEKHTKEFDAIYQNVLMLQEKHYDGSPVKLLGVSLGSLIGKGQNNVQLNLFELPKIDIKEELNKKIPNANFIYLKDYKNETK